MTIKWQVSKPPKMTASHFAWLAELIREYSTSELERTRLTFWFAGHMKATNAKFNRNAFVQACSPSAFENRRKRRTRKCV